MCRLACSCGRRGDARGDRVFYRLRFLRGGRLGEPMDGRRRLGPRGVICGCDAWFAGRSLGTLWAITSPATPSATPARAALARLLGTIARRDRTNRVDAWRRGCRQVRIFQHVGHIGACRLLPLGRLRRCGIAGFLPLIVARRAWRRVAFRFAWLPPLAALTVLPWRRLRARRRFDRSLRVGTTRFVAGPGVATLAALSLVATWMSVATGVAASPAFAGSRGTAFACALGGRRSCRRLRGRRGVSRRGAEPVQHFRQPRRWLWSLERDLRTRGRTRHADGGRLRWRDALDDGFLTRLLRLFLACEGVHVLRLLDHLERRRQRLALVQLVVAHPLHAVVRRFEMTVRNEQYVDLETRLDGGYLGTLFVEQERCDVDRHLRNDLRGVVLHRFFLNDPQDVQCRRFGAPDVADAMATRAGEVSRFGQCRTQPLTRQLHQPEARDLAELHAGAIVLERIAQPVFDFALVLGAFHVDEVDHDQAAQVAQP